MFQMNEPKDVAVSVGLSIIGEHQFLKYVYLLRHHVDTHWSSQCYQ